MDKVTLPVKFEALMEITKSFIHDGSKIEKGEEPNKGDFILEAFAATTDIDLQGDRITEEALKGSEKDLEKNSTVLFNHNLDAPVGKTLFSEARTGGLFVRIRISETVPDIRKQIEEGVINKLSIRGQVLKAESELDKESGQLINVIKQMFLTENSLVTLPANTEARALAFYIQKSMRGETVEKPGEKTNKTEPKPEVKADPPKNEPVKKTHMEQLAEVEASVKDILKQELTDDSKAALATVMTLLDAISSSVEDEGVKAKVDEIKGLITAVMKPAEDENSEHEEEDKKPDDTNTEDKPEEEKANPPTETQPAPGAGGGMETTKAGDGKPEKPADNPLADPRMEALSKQVGELVETVKSMNERRAATSGVPHSLRKGEIGESRIRSTIADKDARALPPKDFRPRDALLDALGSTPQPGA